MKFYIKQHVFTWGERFSVYNAYGNEAFSVEGEIFTFGKKLHIFSPLGNELAFIKQRLFTFIPVYDIMINDTQIASVIKEFTFFRHEYTVEGLNWKVDGDFLSHDYEISSEGVAVASVSKSWFALGDAYEIDISDRIDPLAVLCVVIVIDACLDSN